MTDQINPDHYKRGPVEAIDVIEAAIADAPHMVPAYLHGQALKYLLRIWCKGNALQDARKCRWYLDRLIRQTGGMMHLPGLNLLERAALWVLVRSPRTSLMPPSRDRDPDWRRSFNHENTSRPNGPPPLEFRRSTDKPRFPPPRIIREDFLP